MKLSKPKFSIALFLFLAVAANSFAQTKTPKIDKKQMAARVKSEFLHAWNGYKKYAWGHDDLKPLSKTYRDWYGQTLLMTPVDSLDSLYLLGFKDEADTTRKLYHGKFSV